MPYSIGERGSYGCSGYPVVKDGTNEVMGCHETITQAQNQITAINMSEAEQGKKKMTSAMGQPEPADYRESMFNWSTPVRKPERSVFRVDKAEMPKEIKKRYTVRSNYAGCEGFALVEIDEDGEEDLEGCYETREQAEAAARMENSEERESDLESSPETNNTIMSTMGKQDMPIKEGDFVMGITMDGPVFGRVEHIMWEGGTLGQPGEEYSLESMPPENPAMSVRVFEVEENKMEPTPYSIGMMYQDAQIVDVSNMTMEQEDEMEMMSKAETYSPNEGMKAAARRALKWKEDGEATGAGTPVGWGRARDIVAGRSMSLSVVRRMFSFFSRHEVDKQAEGFNSGEKGYPSNGRIMWDAWGGDAGFSWSRAIVERNREKSLAEDLFGLTNISKVKEEYAIKRERTMETRRRLAESGQAMPDGSYPIVTIEDLRNAIQAVGRAKDYEAARRHIIRRARALGRTDLLPEEWSGEKFWDIKDLTKTDRMVVKADSVRVGQMVSWNSSGGRAQGKVTRIIRSGSYNVPDSDFVIDATEENPAVVITLYRDGKPTDTTVAHRMSTLRAL